MKIQDVCCLPYWISDPLPEINTGLPLPSSAMEMTELDNLFLIYSPEMK
jgi:hypothetical protein